MTIQKKSASVTAYIARVIGGLIIILLGIAGIRSVLTADKSHWLAIVIIVMAVPISLLFLLVGFIMISGDMPGKKRRKVAPEKLGAKNKK